MFDGQLRRAVDPLLDRIADMLAGAGVKPDHITLAGFALAVAGAGLIVAGAFLPALAILVLSRLCDGLDGQVARKTGTTDFGSYLDIVLDFAFYGMVPVAFALHDPAANAVPAAVLVLAFYVNGASFLALAALAEKRGLSTDERGQKGFYFVAGLAEAGETFAVFALFCLAPAWFAMVAFGFAGLCAVTTLARIAQARWLLAPQA